MGIHKVVLEACPSAARKPLLLGWNRIRLIPKRSGRLPRASGIMASAVELTDGPG